MNKHVVVSSTRKVALLLSFLFFISHSIFCQSFLVNQINTIPAYGINPLPKKILVLSTVGVENREYRTSKEELFLGIIDSIMLQISHDLNYNIHVPAEAILGTTSWDSLGTTIFETMAQHQASHAIVISGFNVYFNQTEVEVTQTSNGKDKEAYYDIVSYIRYQLFNDQVMATSFPLTQNRRHSSRSVVSGLLAAGPNVVKNKEDALSISRANSYQLLDYFFSRPIQRTRKLFDKKELSNVRVAIANQDYDKAFQESKKFTHHENRKLAAKANYNCAMIMEHKQEPEQAKLYLQESLGLFQLQLAIPIKEDYGMNLNNPSNSFYNTE